MGSIKLIATVGTVLSLLCNYAIALDNNGAEEEPRDFSSYGEYQEYAAKKAERVVSRSKHSLGFGLNYGGLGYRYSFLGKSVNPFVSVLIPPLLMSAGLEFHSEKLPRQSIDIFIGNLLDTKYAGAIWKWHPAGNQNADLEIGLGIAHFPKQNEDSGWFGVEEAVTVPTWSIAIKF